MDRQVAFTKRAAAQISVNPFDYLTELQKHAKELARDPVVWMPWNNCRNLEQAGTGKGSP